MLFLQGFHLGDSAVEEQKKTWKTFFAELDSCKALERPFTLILRDPLANSFISSVSEDPMKDPRMQVSPVADVLHLVQSYCSNVRRPCVENSKSSYTSRFVVHVVVRAIGYRLS